MDDMLPLCIQIQGWFHQCDGAADTVIPILALNDIQYPVDIGPMLGLYIFGSIDSCLFARGITLTLPRCEAGVPLFLPL